MTAKDGHFNRFVFQVGVPVRVWDLKNKEPPSNEKEEMSTRGKRKNQPDHAKTDAQLALFSDKFFQRKKSRREAKKQNKRMDGMKNAQECTVSLAKGNPGSLI